MCLKPGLPPVRAQIHPYSRKSLAAGLDVSTIKALTNSEKRKEKSRDAARSRRGKESEIFSQLASTLPLPPQSIAQLDKASIMRLCIAYLKTRDLAQQVLGQHSFDATSKSEEMGPYSPGGSRSPLPTGRNLVPGSSFWGDCEANSVLLKALDGFLLVLSHEGDVIYCSENVSTFLGISQVEVMGQPLFEFVHPCDHDEMRQFSGSSGINHRHAFIRLKSTLSNKGRNINLKSASHKIIQLAGQVCHSKGGVEGGGNRGDESPSCGTASLGDSWVIALAIPVPHPSNIEIPLDKQTFISKHSLDMKFTYVDKNISSFCGYNPSDLIGLSFYELHHALDAHHVKDAYKTLRQKGQVETTSYRFLAHGGGYIWVVTQATLIAGPKETKPQYIVCLNYVLSDVEESGQIFSELQLQAAASSSSSPHPPPDSPHRKDEPCKGLLGARITPLNAAASTCHPLGSAIPAVVVTPSPTLVTPKSFRPVSVEPCVESFAPKAINDAAYSKPCPVASTFQLLTSRTEDMNKGYLTFTNNDPHTAVLEDKPKDLTHLAPSGGDDCIPLDIPIYMPDFDNVVCEVKEPSMLEHYQTLLSRTSEANFPSIKKDTPKKRQPISSPTISSATHLDNGTPPPMFEPLSNSILIQNCSKNDDRFTSSVICQEDIGNPPFIDCFDSSSLSSFDTTDSQYSPAPLLSQSASNASPSSNRSGGHSSSTINRPQGTSPYEGLSTNRSTMDVFDLKLEEDDLDLKTPIDDMLVCEGDDFYGPSCQETLSPPTLGFISEIESLDDDSSSMKCHQRVSRDSPFLRSHSPCSNQRLSETGGSFVDPNQVLPGHYIIKGEDEDSSQELRHLLEDSPPLSAKTRVETPPPLFSIFNESSKRLYSPSSSPVMANKRIRRPSASKLISLQPLSGNRERSGRKCTPDPIPPPPFAPTMQRLLVSKEPITVQGRFISSPLGGKAFSSSASKNLSWQPSSSALPCANGASSGGTTGGHSVLRNLLVSGRDDLAGYTVVVSGISSPAHISNSPSSSPNNSPHLVSSSHSSKGSKNCNTGKEELANFASLSSLDALPVNQDGKFEFTREELASLLTSAGVSVPSKGQITSISNPRTSTTVSSSAMAATTPARLGREREQAPPRSRGFKLQDPCLLVSPNTSIPSLLDLTNFDYDVNAPAPSACLLQGADLLMALDQAL